MRCENSASFHYWEPNDEDLRKGIDEVEARISALEKELEEAGK